MLTVPAGWTGQVQGSHVMSSYAQVFTLGDLTQPAVLAPPIHDGQVVMDRAAAYRRTLDLTLIDDDQQYAGADAAPRLTPAAAGDLLTPYGTVVQVFRGVAVPGYVHPTFGTNVYYCPLGMFRLGRSEPTPDGLVKLRGYDFSRTISRNRFTVPWIVSAGSDYVTAILAIGADRMPGGLWRVGQVTAAGEAAPQLVFEADSDPWQAMTSMAAAVGCEPQFDGNGYFTLLEVPNPVSQPIVASYIEGAADTVLASAALIEAAAPMDDEEAFNGVVMVAEAATLLAPLRSEAWDDDPTSPTYRLGPYGPVPRPTQTTAFAATQAQLDNIARVELLKILSAGEPAQFTALPNPAHELADVVRLARPRGGVQDGAYILDQLTMPLRGSALMQGTARRRRGGPT
jgi:hypothetical protein